MTIRNLYEAYARKRTQTKTTNQRSRFSKIPKKNWVCTQQSGKGNWFL